jgi:hypothetical protein
MKRKTVPIYRPLQVTKSRLGRVRFMNRKEQKCAKYASRGTSWENSTCEMNRLKCNFKTIIRKKRCEADGCNSCRLSRVESWVIGSCYKTHYANQSVNN